MSSEEPSVAWLIFVVLGGIAELMVFLFLKKFLPMLKKHFSVNPESTINRGTSIKVQDLLGFELLGSFIDLMSNIRVDIDKYHDEWYSEAFKLPQKFNVNESVPRNYARKTTLENLPAESPSHYYKLSLSISLIDTVLSELKRKFKTNQKCIFEGLHKTPYVKVGPLKNNGKITLKFLWNFIKVTLRNLVLSH